MFHLCSECGSNYHGLDRGCLKMGGAAKCIYHAVGTKNGKTLRMAFQNCVCIFLAVLLTSPYDPKYSICRTMVTRGVTACRR